ncbi:hypothetical protein V493_03392 [Pseudogymnoascus sp. VKM F-4281 (FW-2241)]|nr:hypothetical protein V493_03392 [Pseudogymnoascus sp. VKM F-4281 (FW-2241)]
MPSKIQLDENLCFLYTCLQKSDYNNIDFHAVGAVTNLKPPAARMRYTRLRRQIESGTLIGTHGRKVFQKSGCGGGERGFDLSRKRKRGGVGVAVEEGRDDDDDDEEEVAVEAEGEEEVITGVTGEVKGANKYASDGDESDHERESDNDETTLLAKRTLRGAAIQQQITPQRGCETHDRPVSNSPPPPPPPPLLRPAMVGRAAAAAAVAAGERDAAGSAGSESCCRGG